MKKCVSKLRKLGEKYFHNYKCQMNFKSAHLENNNCPQFDCLKLAGFKNKIRLLTRKIIYPT